MVVILRLQCIIFNNPNCDKKRERERRRKTVLLSPHWYLLERARKDPPYWDRVTSETLTSWAQHLGEEKVLYR